MFSLGQPTENRTRKGESCYDKGKKITCTAVFAAIATIMMYFEFRFRMPPFLKVGSLGRCRARRRVYFGIAPAITMIGIKDLIHLTQTQTAGSGEAADFLMLSTLVIIAVLIYRAHKTRKMAVVGCAAGSVAMACMGMLTNYFLIIPFYVNGMGWNLDHRLCSAAVSTSSACCRSIIRTVITMLVYKKLSVFIRSKQVEFHYSTRQKAN